MYSIMSKQQLIAVNHERAEKWLRECPKSHKLKSYVAIVERFARGELVVSSPNIACSLEIGDYTVGSLSNKHYKWIPRAIAYCHLWQIDDKARAAHDVMIHELRRATPHSTVYSDVGSLRVDADGVELLFGGVGGDGAHKVFFTERYDWREETLLSLFGRASDEFICTFKAKHVKVFAYDCDGGEHGGEVVFEMERETRQTFNIYNVYDKTRGWKIEHLNY